VRRFWAARLTLQAFRNHADTDLVTDDRPVCLFGANGAGKTNILEALTTLAPGRDLRGASPEDLASAGGDPDRLRLWSVAASLNLDGQAMHVGVGLDRTPDGGIKRLARLDGRAASARDLAAAARMLWLTPTMDRLFTGPAGDRRRFFDRLALAREPGHGAAAAAYERAMRQRQRLLNEGMGDPAWLDGLESEMAQHGAAMAAARAQTLRRLQAEIARRPPSAFPHAVIGLEGALQTAALGGEGIGAIADSFVGALRDGRSRDAAAGRCLTGPHRADLVVRHAEKDMPAALCSTGEQKALLFGLILAQARALADDPAAGPALLLLDEAAAHLDADRRAALYDELLALPGQAWLTGTDESLFEAFGEHAQRFAVRDGKAAPV
jgi:DNA replication and repair protein RecF